MIWPWADDYSKLRPGILSSTNSILLFDGWRLRSPFGPSRSTSDPILTLIQPQDRHSAVLPLFCTSASIARPHDLVLVHQNGLKQTTRLQSPNRRNTPSNLQPSLNNPPPTHQQTHNPSRADWRNTLDRQTLPNPYGAIQTSLHKRSQLSKSRRCNTTRYNTRTTLHSSRLRRCRIE